MRRAMVLASVLAMSSAAAAAGTWTPRKGFWAPLVKAGARWTLVSMDGDRDVIEVETYDVRRVGNAEVARIRWTRVFDEGRAELEDGGGRPTQIAVGPRGVWFLGDEANDKTVLAAMKSRPDYRDPPRPRAWPPQRSGQFLVLMRGDDGAATGVCVADLDPRPEGCDSTCFGDLCFDDGGFKLLDGYWAPGDGIYERR